LLAATTAKVVIGAVQSAEDERFDVLASLPRVTGFYFAVVRGAACRRVGALERILRRVEISSGHRR
jgi:hypothetical protein